MDYLKKIITDFELHSVEGIRDCFENGLNPDELVNGKPLIYELINMYSRGPKFKECIREFIDHGVKFEDKALLAVLSDDAQALDKLLKQDISVLEKKYSFQSAFTP